MRGKWNLIPAGLALLLCLMMIVAAAFAEDYTVVEEKDPAENALPIDFSPGMPLNQENFISEMEYEDPTIKVVIRQYSVERRYDYWIADIEIADASQLRTVSADGFDSDGLGPPTIMAEYMNAVLAINGDYFSYKGHDFVIRQGITYLDHLNATRDILVIDEDGDFHGFISPDRGEIGDTVDGKRIINAFSFGPLLGVAFPDIVDAMEHVREADRAKGMSVVDFQELIAGMPDVKIAYNLDGGDSTFLIMNGKKLNFPDNVNARDGIRNEGLADIIYFASAYSEEP